MDTVVQLSLYSGVRGGLNVNLNVQLVNSLGLLVDIDSKLVHFSGRAGQIVHVDLDLSSVLDLLDCNSFLQVSLDGFLLGLINVDVDILVDLNSLTDLLDSILSVVLPQINLSCERNLNSSYYATTNYSTATTNYSTYAN